MQTHLYSPKGGQGCSTVAVALALASAPAVLVDLTGSEDTAAIAGIPWSDYDARQGAQVAPDVYLYGPDAIDGTAYRTAIYDHGTHLFEPSKAPDARYLIVVRGPCYVALRRALIHPVRPDGVILIQEPARSLHAKDVDRALGAPIVAVIDWDPAIARAVDAGLMTARPPRALVRNLAGVIVARDPEPAA